MNERLNWMLPSFEIVRIGSLRIRMDFSFFLIGAFFLFRLGWMLGAAFLGILMVSVLLHELGHVCLARMTGGSATDIRLTPIGGLATVQPGRGTWASIVTTAGGPFVNLVICLAILWILPSDAYRSALVPFTFPLTKLDLEQLPRDLGIIAFVVNWMLFIINMLPMLPLDGAQIVRSVLASQKHPELVNRSAVQISMVVAGLLSIAGLAFDIAPLVFLSAVVFIVNLVEFYENERIDGDEDSFLGYDFSDGYSSLDRPVAAGGGTQPSEAQPGLVEQWRERRRQQQEQAIRRQQEQAEQQLDELLAKVHAHGMNSLTSREQQTLKQVSDLLRDRSKRTE
ncbi:MAG: M50 family metallopeptidase [Planctomycetaceae bacterium]